MTEREPFAKVVRKPNLHGIDAYLVACDGHPVEVDGDPVSAYIAAELTNDAHEARVKEAVRGAVEEFRERAVKLMREHPCTASIYGDGAVARGAKSSADYLASLVESLPTEPEGK